MEVNVMWLPPLIEPIALNPRTSTIPIMDRFSAETFEYFTYDRFGVRGIFNWDFDYRAVKRNDYLPVTPKQIPIMLGCAFAINREYFWHLGGYDEGLQIWNGKK
jgi:polypeptide N-acetylgalactosaminyltransferase